MSNKIFMRFLYSLLVIIGLCFVGLGILNTSWGHSLMVQHYVNSSVKDVSKKKLESNKKVPTTFNPKVVKSVSTSDLLKSYKGNKNVIGFMSIPSQNIKNPIFNGYGENGENMMYGVATMKANQQMGMGNYALAGHYMDGNTVFHNLHKVKKGSNVYLTDLNFIYKYRITKVSKKVSPYATEVIQDKNFGENITMVTCADYSSDIQHGSMRTVVQGELVSTYLSTNKELKKLHLYKY